MRMPLLRLEFRIFTDAHYDFVQRHGRLRHKLFAVFQARQREDSPNQFVQSGRLQFDAINDGRLNDFFDRNKDAFFWLANGIREASDMGIGDARFPWVIDLKRRAFVQLTLQDAPEVQQDISTTEYYRSPRVACKSSQVK